MFSELDDRDPLPASVPDQRAATIARGRQLRRNRRAAVAVACAAPVVLVGILLAVPRNAASTPPVAPAPAPTATPLPRPTGPTLALYPQCDDPGGAEPGGDSACPTGSPAARYASVIQGDDGVHQPFTVVLPAGWHSLGGNSPDDVRFARQGAVNTVYPYGVSLIADDGSRGLVMTLNPSLVTASPDGRWTYADPYGDYVPRLVARSGDGRTAAVVAGGYPATTIDLADSGEGGGSTAGGCSIGWPCSPLVGPHIPPEAVGGSVPPSMGRLAAAPSRIVVIPLPSSRASDSRTVVIWLWDVGTKGSTTTEVLRAVDPILDTLRFGSGYRVPSGG